MYNRVNPSYFAFKDQVQGYIALIFSKARLRRHRFGVVMRIFWTKKIHKMDMTRMRLKLFIIVENQGNRPIKKNCSWYFQLRTGQKQNKKFFFFSCSYRSGIPQTVFISAIGCSWLTVEKKRDQLQYNILNKSWAVNKIQASSDQKVPRWQQKSHTKNSVQSVYSTI